MGEGVPGSRGRGPLREKGRFEVVDDSVGPLLDNGTEEPVLLLEAALLLRHEALETARLYQVDHFVLDNRLFFIHTMV